MTASPGAEGLENRASVIITPDQRVRVFISSTLEELAEERKGECRAVRKRLERVLGSPVRARAQLPVGVYRAYLEQSQILWAFIGSGMAGWGRAWRSPVWRMSTGWLLVSRCCCI